MTSTSSRTALASALVIAGLFTTRPAAGQASVAQAPSCARCKVALSTELTFQSAWADGGLPTRPFGVVRFARNDWIVLDPDANLIYRFDSRGRYQRTLARRGSGPGEFQTPSLALDWGGDSTVVFDRGNARMTVFDPTGRLIRSTDWVGGSVIRAMHRTAGGFIVADRLATRTSFGMPLHQFGRDGVLVRSFGMPRDTRVTRPADVPVLRLPFRTQADGSFWSVDALKPQLIRWSDAGVRLEEWALPMPDFVVPETTLPDARGGNEFYGIEQLADGRLVVLMAFREARYREAYGRAKAVDNREVMEIEDYGRYFDTRILVLDPKARRLVAFGDVDEFVIGNLGEGRFWAVGPGGDNGKLHLVQVKVIGSP